jgi:hypothetical protein
VRTFVIAFFALATLLMFPQFFAHAGDEALLQKEALSEYRGASRNLAKTMNCLRGKTYPNDIKECGISSFGDAADFEKVETCLVSQVAARAVPIRDKDGKVINTVALAIDCQERRVLIIFKKNGELFSVDGISFLLD